MEWYKYFFINYLKITRYARINDFVYCATAQIRFQQLTYLNDQKLDREKFSG